MGGQTDRNPDQATGLVSRVTLHPLQGHSVLDQTASLAGDMPLPQSKSAAEGMSCDPGSPDARCFSGADGEPLERLSGPQLPGKDSMPIRPPWTGQKARHGLTKRVYSY